MDYGDVDYGRPLVPALDYATGARGSAALVARLFPDRATATAERVPLLLFEHIAAVLDSLRSDEHRVLVLRFGLTDGRERTLREVGEEIGLSGERARQIEAKAFRKLRHPSRSRHLLPLYREWDDDE